MSGYPFFLRAIQRLWSVFWKADLLPRASRFLASTASGGHRSGDPPQNSQSGKSAAAAAGGSGDGGKPRSTTFKTPPTPPPGKTPPPIPKEQLRSTAGTVAPPGTPLVSPAKPTQAGKATKPSTPVAGAKPPPPPTPMGREMKLKARVITIVQPGTPAVGASKQTVKPSTPPLGGQQQHQGKAIKPPTPVFGAPPPSQAGNIAKPPPLVLGAPPPQAAGNIAKPPTPVFGAPPPQAGNIAKPPTPVLGAPPQQAGNIAKPPTPVVSAPPPPPPPPTQFGKTTAQTPPPLSMEAKPPTPVIKAAETGAGDGRKTAMEKVAGTPRPGMKTPAFKEYPPRGNTTPLPIAFKTMRTPVPVAREMKKTLEEMEKSKTTFRFPDTPPPKKKPMSPLPVSKNPPGTGRVTPPKTNKAATPVPTLDNLAKANLPQITETVKKATEKWEVIKASFRFQPSPPPPATPQADKATKPPTPLIKRPPQTDKQIKPPTPLIKKPPQSAESSTQTPPAKAAKPPTPLIKKPPQSQPTPQQAQQTPAQGLTASSLDEDPPARKKPIRTPPVGPIPDKARPVVAEPSPVEVWKLAPPGTPAQRGPPPSRGSSSPPSQSGGQRSGGTPPPSSPTPSLMSKPSPTTSKEMPKTPSRPPHTPPPRPPPRSPRPRSPRVADPIDKKPGKVAAERDKRPPTPVKGGFIATPHLKERTKLAEYQAHLRNKMRKVIRDLEQDEHIDMEEALKLADREVKKNAWAMPKESQVTEPPKEMPGQGQPPKEAPSDSSKTPMEAGTKDIDPPTRTPPQPPRQPVADMGWYHNPEFFEHKNTSFYDIEMDIGKNRGEQPSSKKKKDDKGKKD